MAEPRKYNCVDRDGNPLEKPHVTCRWLEGDCGQRGTVVRPAADDAAERNIQALEQDEFRTVRSNKKTDEAFGRRKGAKDKRPRRTRRKELMAMFKAGAESALRREGVLRPDPAAPPDAPALPAPPPPGPGPSKAELEACVEVYGRVLAARKAKESFAAFVAQAWPVIDPHPYRPNRATDAIIQHQQAIADGVITRLLIAIAPGLGKSTLCSVLYPAWRWARDPSHRMICCSHSYDLAVDLSQKCRRLIESEWYKASFPEVKLVENKENFFVTSAHGRRMAVGIDGSLTGFRGDEGIVDDSLNAKNAYSEAVVNATNRWFTQAFTSRFDGESPPMTIIQQRLTVQDLIGVLVEQGGYQVLSLPAEFNTGRRTATYKNNGELLWQDDRQEDGELLAPEILSAAKIVDRKRDLGSLGFETQFNQNPSDESGAMLPRKWWRFYQQKGIADKRPAGCNSDKAADLPKMEKVVIACDLTFGSLRGDWAVAQVWGSCGGGRYLLEQWRKRAGFEESCVAIRNLASKYPMARVIIEKAANGAAVIETLAKQIPNVIPQIPQGKKEQRAAAVAPTVESGSCYLPAGAAWLDDFVDECATFPGKHDDQVDALAWALIALRTSSAADRLLMAYLPREQRGQVRY